jgi:hypothetical protein
MRRFIAASLLSMAAAVALVFAATFGGGLAAQDATPSLTEDDVPRPAHIHFGTCDELGDVAFPLEDVTGVTIAGSPVASPIVENPENPDVVMGETVIESITEVEANWDTLVGENATYAINVHDSADNMSLYIACGDITGEPENDRLEIELQSLNDSGWQGSAVLEQTGENTITVTVTLADQGDLEATPAL